MPEEKEQSPALVAFDVGNTSAKCALRAQGRWELVCRVATTPTETLAQRLLDELPGSSVASLRPGRCVACSVHPAANESIGAFWRDIGGPGTVELFGTDLPIPIRTEVRERDKVGDDRLLLALGAKQLAGAPCIVVSAGTAITVDWVDESGSFAGGAIAPGFHLAARALHEHTALLPLIKPAATQAGKSPIGADTTEALQSGIYWFCAGGVIALIHRYRAACSSPEAPVVCTGSDAGSLLPALAEFGVSHEPDLLLAGMTAALGSSLNAPG